MRQAAVRAFRTARLVPSRSLALRCRSTFQSSNYVLGIRYASSKNNPPKFGFSTTSSSKTPSNRSTSMYFRRFSVAVLSGLVGYGAWYTYKIQPRYVASANPFSQEQQAQAFSTTASQYGSNPTETDGVRKAVVVGPDSLYTGQITGDGPISKETDESGRKVLEMLTPEQATQKLRRNEESYLVGRGKGVVRYDVVQSPSNDPIEDDHTEQIVEVPQIAGEDGTSSDWMFWGVFDGHSYVI